jgi:ketosteroid isomerase-like protein
MDVEERNRRIVIAGIEAFAERRMDEWRELWHPDVLMVPAPGWPESGPFKGRDIAEASLNRFISEFPDWSLQKVQIHRVRAEWVIASYFIRGHGAASGVEVDTELFMAVRVGNDGLIAEVHFHWTRQDADQTVSGS